MDTSNTAYTSQKFGYLFIYLIKTQLVFIEFQKLAKCRRICNIWLQNLVYFLKVPQYARNISLRMYYLYPLQHVTKLKICFQSESHKNITKSKQSRKFFVSPVKFTKVHARTNETSHFQFFYGNFDLNKEYLFVKCNRSSYHNLWLKASWIHAIFEIYNRGNR